MLGFEADDMRIFLTKPFPRQSEQKAKRRSFHIFFLVLLFFKGEFFIKTVAITAYRIWQGGIDEEAIAKWSQKSFHELSFFFFFLIFIGFENSSIIN